MLFFSVAQIKQHTQQNSYLEKHLKDAIDIGFEKIKHTRIAGIVNPDIEEHSCKHDDLSLYHDKIFAVGREIESKEAGIFHIK